MTHRPAGKQASRHAARRAAHTAALALIVLMLSLTLVACGKKPAKLEPPDDVTDDSYPYIYPDPTTDPKP